MLVVYGRLTFQPACVQPNKLGPYFNPTYTRTGWIGQPPVLDRHEVVTINGDVDTLRQATPLLLLLLLLTHTI